MPANLFDATARQRTAPETDGPLVWTRGAAARLEALVSVRGLSKRDAFQELLAASPLTVVLRVKRGDDLTATAAGEIGSDHEQIWWHSARPVVLSVPSINRGRVAGLEVRNAAGLAIAGKRYRPEMPLPQGGSMRTVTVELPPIVLHTGP
jgi:hypothetical protein